MQYNNTIIHCPGLQCWECGLGGGTCHNSSDTGQLVTCGDGETSCFKSETSQYSTVQYSTVQYSVVQYSSPATAFSL